MSCCGKRAHLLLTGTVPPNGTLSAFWWSFASVHTHGPHVSFQAFVPYDFSVARSWIRRVWQLYELLRGVYFWWIFYIWEYVKVHFCALCMRIITHSLAVTLETLVGFWPHQPASSILFCCSLNWYLSLYFLHLSLLDLSVYFLVCQLVFSLLLCYSINLLSSPPVSSECVLPISVFYF